MQSQVNFGPLGKFLRYLACLAQVAVAFTLAYPYGSPQILSSYAYSSHVQGAPKAAVHKGNGSVTCGSPDAWYCQHRWPEISGMVSSHS